MLSLGDLGSPGNPAKRWGGGEGFPGLPGPPRLETSRISGRFPPPPPPISPTPVCRIMKATAFRKITANDPSPVGLLCTRHQVGLQVQKTNRRQVNARDRPWWPFQRANTYVFTVVTVVAVSQGKQYMFFKPARTPANPKIGRKGGPGPPQYRRTVLGNHWISKPGWGTGWAPSVCPNQNAYPLYKTPPNGHHVTALMCDVRLDEIQSS